MKLMHYRSSPMPPLNREVPKQMGWPTEMKPKGLWVSVKGERDWPSWCESVDFRWPEGFRYAYEVTLAKGANVLVIENAEQFDGFEAAYSEKVDPHPMQFVNWSRVASDYDGIIIAPYRSDRRMKNGSPWYYGWDCASGCIWNIEAVASINHITKENDNDDHVSRLEGSA